MSCADHVFIHPLLGGDDAWSGFRVEFAPGHANPAGLDRLCTSPLLAEFDQRHPWLIPAQANSKAAEQLGERGISLFPAKSPTDDAAALSALEAQLRQARHKVGLIASPESKLPAAGTWDYLLINVSHARSLPPYSLLGLASRTAIVADEVFTQNDRDWTLNNACTLTTSEYMMVRSDSHSTADITRLKLLKLLTLIESDANTSALDAVFREESKLSYSLLRLVNSAALAPRTPIISFAQAINLLGRRQLQRWLQLLVYSDPNNGQHPNPLLLKAAARGRMVELLASHLVPSIEVTTDVAFMIGTFSLLDVLLNMPMPKILDQLPLPDIAQKSLAAHDGALGQLLNVFDAADKRDLQAAANGLAALGISSEDYVDTQLSALAWATKIRTA